jgi:electron transfer flavoprotein alpha subunit
VSATTWIIGEVEDDRLQRSSPGVATLGRALAERAGHDAVGIVVGPAAEAAAGELAAYLPSVLALDVATPDGFLDPADAAAIVAALVEERAPAHLVIPATPAGRTLAGALAARLQWGLLTNAVDLEWVDGPIVHTVVFRTDLHVRSAFTGDHGIITVQPNVVRPEALAAPGVVEVIAVAHPPVATASRVRRTDLVRRAAQPSVEGATVIVAGGAGIGSAEAWPIVGELADALHGAVGASRPPVDAGWVPISQQVGQTGKSVRPDLYVALGISGEIQHRVGMRTARTVVAINLDPDAPIRSFSDLFVIGDLHQIVPELVASIRARPGG